MLLLRVCVYVHLSVTIKSGCFVKMTQLAKLVFITDTSFDLPNCVCCMKIRVSVKPRVLPFWNFVPNRLLNMSQRYVDRCKTEVAP